MFPEKRPLLAETPEEFDVMMDIFFELVELQMAATEWTIAMYSPPQPPEALSMERIALAKKRLITKVANMLSEAKSRPATIEPTT